MRFQLKTVLCWEAVLVFCIFIVCFVLILLLFAFENYFYFSSASKENSQTGPSLVRGPLQTLLQRRQWHPTPALLPGESHGRRGLVGCSPWGRWESDTTEQLHFHFSLSCIGEGNGNPLQCSCLENSRDGGAWWAAICGVAQSRTRLK